MIIVLAPLFFTAAMLYAMVGFGGGSAYLAMLATAGISFHDMPSTALICNIIVVTGGCYFFIKEKHLSLKCILPFLIASIPLAYVGGRIPIEKNTFLIVLGIVLLIAAIRMLLNEKKFQTEREIAWKEALQYGIPIGGVLGFVSGITGIGGGIYLAPILYFLGWGNPKTIAASASLFILVNSIAGLSGQLIKNSFVVDWHLILPLAVAVFIGGQIGSRFGSQKISRLTVQRLTAILILFVSLRILWHAF